jgi:hypothetical protein
MHKDDLIKLAWQVIDQLEGQSSMEQKQAFMMQLLAFMPDTALLALQFAYEMTPNQGRQMVEGPQDA